jgi:hypothetical protein
MQMNSGNNDYVSGQPGTRLSAVIRDVHFWVPAIVLIAGLILLRWVS